MSVAVNQHTNRNPDRLFFLGMAIASVIIVLIGFSSSYFFRGSELAPLTPLYHLHGLLFTTWIVLLVTQTSLVAAHRTDIHRRLGVAGASLAAIIFVVGVAVSIETLRRGGGPPGIDPRIFFSIPLSDITAFGVLVTAAMLLRRRSAYHKRLMLLATIALLTAAVARFPVQFGLPGLADFFVGIDILVVAIVLYDFASQGRLHPATLWGGMMIVVYRPLLAFVAHSPVWFAFADALR